MKRTLLLPWLLTAASILSVASAEPPGNPPRPVILFWGADVARLQPEFARLLNAQAFEVRWGEPTPELLNTVNALVLIRARAERHRSQPASSLSLFAIRQWESGRLAVCGIHSSFLFASGFSPALGRVALDAGVDMPQFDVGKLQAQLRKDRVYLEDVPA